MAKLYFKYGCMGSCKTIQALTTQFNYEEKGMGTWLIKPETDTRDGAAIIKSRIGIQKEADVIKKCDSIMYLFNQLIVDKIIDVIIVDESQFLLPEQIEELRDIVDKYDIAVICFGLRTDFQTHFFPGSHRLMEIADCIEEIKTMCKCGNKAIVNARINSEGKVITDGEQILIGGNDTYEAMCYKCYSLLSLTP